MNGREVAARLCAIAQLVLEGKSDRESTIRRLAKLQKELQPAEQTTLRIESPPQYQIQLGEIWEHWCRTMSRKGSKFTRDRQVKVLARLKEGYTVEQIKQAIDGVSRSEWHMGANDRATAYNDLTLICSTGARLEQYMGLGDGGSAPSVGGQGKTRAAIEDLKEGRQQHGEGDPGRLWGARPRSRSGG